jgi:hypothetical protein
VIINIDVEMDINSILAWKLHYPGNYIPDWYQPEDFLEVRLGAPVPEEEPCEPDITAGTITSKYIRTAHIASGCITDSRVCSTSKS